MRRALLVGIDDYPDAPLAGCVKDARAVDTLLKQHEDGSHNFDTRLLTRPADNITRAILKRAIDELFRAEADVALLYFSGHGTENDLGGYLVTPDAKDYDEGVSMSDVLTMANNSPVREVVIVIDSCHSGAFGNPPAIDNTRALLREGISILTASRASEPAMEVEDQGVFTTLFCAALDGGAADVVGDVSVAGTYAYVGQSLGAWDQRPLFKAHVFRLTPLRKCRAAVDLAVLRRLPEWFPTPSSEFQLDPSFEPTAAPAHPDHEAVFTQLQKCRDAKLIIPVGEDHMYYAAMKSKSCRLTPLGRHYRRLANDGRI